MTKSIFDVFDAILDSKPLLATLKPSEYRPFWQLYNYEEGKPDNPASGKKSINFDEEMAERLIKIIERRKDGYYRDIERRRASAAMQNLYNSLFDNIACRGENTDLNCYSNKVVMAIKHECQREPIFREAERIAEDYCWRGNCNPLDDEQCQKYYGASAKEIVDEAIGIAIETIKKHIGEPTGMSKTADTYFENGTLHMQMDTEGNTHSETKANPGINHLYDSLFGKGNYRINLNIDMPEASKQIQAEQNILKAEKPAELYYGLFLAIRDFFRTVKKNKEEASMASYEAKKNMERNQWSRRDLTELIAKGVYTTKTTKREIRLGKILEWCRHQDGLDPRIYRIAKEYNHLCPTKASKYVVIISRHPYDMAGMSTGRGWGSCMNINWGDFRRYVASSITGGAIIAYLCNTDDDNIEHPLGRILIKPYVRDSSEKGKAKIDLENPHFILVCSQSYGTFPKQIIREVQDWINENWNEKIEIRENEEFEISDQMYHDSTDADGLRISSVRDIRPSGM